MLQQLSFMTMVATLLRQLRRLLQIKMITTNAPFVLQFAAQPKNITNNSENIVYLAPPAYHQKIQQLHRKQKNNQPRKSFIHSGSEIEFTRFPLLKSSMEKLRIQSNIFWEYLFRSFKSLDLYKDTVVIHQLIYPFCI